MSVTTEVIGDRFIVEWTIVDEAGAPVATATVAGLVSTPSGGSAAMSVSNVSNVYKLGYTVAAAGKHGWKATATGAAVGAIDGVFVAPRDAVGLPPITVDPTTDIGLVRLLCTDLNEVEPLFEDAQIAAFLSLEGVVKRAAALALETIAVSEALISKKITTQDLSVDGPAVAKELRERAKSLREQAGVEAGATDDYGLDIAYFDPCAAYWTTC